MSGFFVKGVLRSKFINRYKVGDGREEFEQKILQVETFNKDGKIFLTEVVIPKNAGLDLDDFDVGKEVTLPVFVFSRVGKNGKAYQNVFLR